MLDHYTHEFDQVDSETIRSIKGDLKRLIHKANPYILLIISESINQETNEKNQINLFIEDEKKQQAKRR